MTHFYLHHVWNAYEFISHSGFRDCIPVVNFKPPRIVGTVGTKLLFLYREHFQATTANINPITHTCTYIIVHGLSYNFLPQCPYLHDNLKTFTKVFSSYISVGGLRINRRTASD